MTNQQRPTRRRGAELTKAIHEAVNLELQENGFDGVTFDRIAQRGSLSKATLYSRYRSPAHLVADALGSRSRRTEFHTSGSLEADLMKILTTALAAIDSIGVEVFRKLIGSSDVAILSYIADESPLGHQALNEAVESARSRGELGATPLTEDAIRVPVEVLHSRVLLTEDRQGLAEAIVQNVALPLYTALSYADPPSTR